MLTCYQKGRDKYQYPSKVDCQTKPCVGKPLCCMHRSLYISEKCKHVKDNLMKKLCSFTHTISLVMIIAFTFPAWLAFIFPAWYTLFSKCGLSK